MAEVTVNFDSKAYTVNNSVNKKGFKFDNPGGGTQRTFNINKIVLDIADMSVQVKYKELDSDDVNSYESPVLSTLGVQFGGLGSFITGDNLDLRLLKVVAINQLFLQKLGIEPLESDGSVKVEYQ